MPGENGSSFPLGVLCSATNKSTQPFVFQEVALYCHLFPCGVGEESAKLPFKRLVFTVNRMGSGHD